LHLGALFVVAVAVPLTGRLHWGALDGSMRSRSDSYRLEIVARDADGSERFVSPTAVASRSAYDVRNALSGAERFRSGAAIGVLRSFLPDLAELVCRTTDAAEVDLELQSRVSPLAPVESTTLHLDSPRAPRRARVRREASWSRRPRRSP
jgi:hypothetical protein